jgi:single-stranded-DNA-specific exonuclease
LTSEAAKWDIAPPAPEHIAGRLPDIPPLLVQLLYNRGLCDAPEIEAFLSGEYKADHPFVVKGMNEAVARIRQAIREGERMAVYGDFDADGVTATALMVTALRSLGGTVTPYIPNRLDESYGLNREALARLAQDGTRLLITVDCGIRAPEEVAFGNSLGLEFIITDHHTAPAPEDLPPAVAIVNPQQEGCPYPFKRLAGVGVAFKVADALFRAHNYGLGSTGESARLESEKLLDLVALGSVADVVPLREENRFLVRQGLQLINSGQARPGVRALMDEARLRPGHVDAESIGYGLGPRLNAAGRLDSALKSYRLLLSTSEEEAHALAASLGEINRKRQEMTRELLSVAKAEAESTLEERICIVTGPEYHVGLVGLIAGRLREEYHRPAIAIRMDTETSRGSARSIPGFHITRALGKCEPLLIRYGGHAMAAGFEVENSNLDTLVSRLRAVARDELTEQDLIPTISIDAELPAEQITFDTIDLLDWLAPFGTDNERPVFVTRGLRVRGCRIVGSGHLKLLLSDGVVVLDGIAFRQGGRYAGEFPDCVDVVYTLNRHEWNGQTSLQLVIKDFRPSQA